MKPDFSKATPRPREATAMASFIRDLAALAAVGLFLAAIIVWMAIIEDSRPPQVERIETQIVWEI